MKQGPVKSKVQVQYIPQVFAFFLRYDDHEQKAIDC